MWYTWKIAQNNNLQDIHWGQKRYAWTEKFNKELKTSKEYQTDILELKEMTTKLKISLESFN